MSLNNLRFIINKLQGIEDWKLNKLNEEVNILYVALTRAKHSLVLNEALTDLLEFCSGTYLCIRNLQEDKSLISNRRVTVRTKSLIGCEKRNQFKLLSRVPSPSPPPSP